jgi:hypothetical protein
MSWRAAAAWALAAAAEARDAARQSMCSSGAMLALVPLLQVCVSGAALS